MGRQQVKCSKQSTGVSYNNQTRAEALERKGESGGKPEVVAEERLSAGNEEAETADCADC